MSDRKQPIDSAVPPEDWCTYSSMPVARSQYKLKAAQALTDGNYGKSIYYDCKALDLGFRCGHQQVSKRLKKKTISDAEIQSKIQNCDSNASLFDACAIALDNVQFKSCATKQNVDMSAVQDDEFEDVAKICAKLPSEWNIVQLSLVENPFLAYATRKDCYTRDTQIRLTILSSEDIPGSTNEPIVITLDLNGTSDDNIFTLAYSVYHVLYKNFTTYNGQGYSTFITELTQQQSKLLADMIQWLGPWITLFSGKIRSNEGLKCEANLLGTIKAYVTDNQLSLDGVQMKLIYLVARRVELLNTTYIKQASKYIGHTSTETRAIEKLFLQLRVKAMNADADSKFEYYPCILVIDEILDSMPWEMILPMQEFTRVHSIFFLRNLYNKYKTQIQDGYLNVAITSGFSLINPDNDEKLQKMRQRLIDFYKTNLPDWKTIDNRPTTAEEFEDICTNYSIFVYSGHGSSLQLYNSMSIDHIKSNSIQFLFGCTSIGMKANGLISLATGPSHTFFKMGSPGMLGAITVVTDTWIDVVTVYILSQWIIPAVSKRIQFDVIDTFNKDRVDEILVRIHDKKEPNLLKILCNIRNEQTISLRIRSAIVFRGLPLYSTSIKKQ